MTSTSRPTSVERRQSITNVVAVAVETPVAVKDVDVMSALAGRPYRCPR